ncbi:MAG: sterol desaturase family protein [Rhodomicrobium sp.]
MIYEQLHAILARMGEIYSRQIPAIAGLAILFTILTVFKSQASSPGKVWWRNPGLVTDACNAVVNGVLAPYCKLAYLLVIFLLLSGTFSKSAIDDYFNNGRGPLNGLSFWWQAAIYLLLADFLAYWIHRVFHGGVFWKYHAIHHSAKQVDWTTAYRIHPVNMMAQPVLIGVAMLMLGISPEVMVLLVPWDIFSAALVHANVKWTFGPLKYILATPVFHRWHHCLPDDGGDTNFAPTFAFWDVLFGTFRMPHDRLPQAFGVEDRQYPEGYLQQLIYPFKSRKEPAAAGPIIDPANLPVQRMN